MFKDFGNTVSINGIIVPKAVFRYFEPSYEEPPTGYVRTYIPNKIHQLYNQSIGKSFCLSSKWSEGDRYLSRVGEFVRYLQHERIHDLEIQKEIQKVNPHGTIIQTKKQN